MGDHNRRTLFTATLTGYRGFLPESASGIRISTEYRVEKHDCRILRNGLARPLPTDRHGTAQIRAEFAREYRGDPLSSK